MKTYVIAFDGRKKNSLGICYKNTATRKGETFDDAILALYDEFEHISFPTVISESDDNNEWE
jgi:hypothetical protein